MFQQIVILIHNATPTEREWEKLNSVIQRPNGLKQESVKFFCSLCLSVSLRLSLSLSLSSSRHKQTLEPHEGFHSELGACFSASFYINFFSRALIFNRPPSWTLYQARKRGPILLTPLTIKKKKKKKKKLIVGLLWKIN